MSTSLFSSLRNKLSSGHIATSASTLLPFSLDWSDAGLVLSKHPSPVISKMAVSSASSSHLDSLAISVNWSLERHGAFGDLVLLPIMLGLHPSLSSMYSTMQDVVLGFLNVEIFGV